MSDPYFSNVQLLLPFDGANGSTTFTDASGTPKVVSIAAGSPTISTAQSKYGGASLLLSSAAYPAPPASLLTPATPFQMAPGTAFCVEFWLYLNAFSEDVYSTVVALGAPAVGGGSVRDGWAVFVMNTGRISFRMGLIGDSKALSTPSSLITTGVWNHVAVAVTGTSAVPKIFIGGQSRTLTASGSSTAWNLIDGRETDSTDLYIGAFEDSGGSIPFALNANLDDLRITVGVARYSADFTPPGELVATVQARASAPGPLGSAQAQALAGSGFWASTPSMLGQPSVLTFHDFSKLISPTAVSRYLMDMSTMSGTVRLPISSWQATLRSTEPSYLQCVVPACQPYVNLISEAVSFQVSRSAPTLNGGTAIIVVASAPLEVPALAQGGLNYSATLSGYGLAVSGSEGVSRELVEVRTVFTYSTGYRVRCSIDWVLRPGHTALFGGASFVVRYISYYVNESDAFMDVGE